MILPMNKQVYILLSLPTKKKPGIIFQEEERENEGSGREGVRGRFRFHV